MGRQMDANPDHRQLYLRLLTDSQTVRHYLNLKLAISTDEKLQANAERNFENDFGICTLENSNSRVQLLRQLIAAFNRDMLPTLWLKSYDLTLKQASYDENESIQVPDKVWARLQHTLLKMRRPRPRPVTRRSLMHCIFILAVDLFGKHFTTKKKTCKRRDALKSNVYNYETDCVALFVNLCMNKICKKWSHRKDCFLDHFRSLPSFALTPIFVNLCIKKFGSLPITTDSEFRESVYKENMQKVESPERLLFAHPLRV